MAVITTELLGQTYPFHSGYELLREPLYCLGCSYAMQGWVVWPATDAPTLDDPFGPWFELWARGASVSYEGDQEQLVCVVTAP